MFLKILQSIKSNQLFIKSGASVIARITSVATLVISTAFATRMFSPEEFGLWAVFLSLLFILVNFDFGYRYSMGNRLAALVASSNGNENENENDEQRELYLSIFLLEVFLAFIGVLLTILIVPLFQWNLILKIHQLSLVNNINLYIIIVVSLNFISLPFTLNGPGYFAFQEINLVSLLNAAFSIFQLLIFIGSCYLLSFKWVLLLYFFVYTLNPVVLTFLFFFKRKWKFKFISFQLQKKHIKSLFNLSLNFFILSISSSIISAVSTIMVGTIGGIRSAGSFELIRRIFGLLVTMHLAVLSPLSPFFTQSAQLGRWDLINQKLSFCLRKVWPLIFFGIGGLIYVFHPFVLKMWTGLELSNYLLAGLLAFVAVLSGWGNTYSIILNSLGLVKWQAAYSIIFVPISIFLPLILGKFWGITGVAIASIICLLPGVIIWPIYTRKAIKAKLLKL